MNPSTGDDVNLNSLGHFMKEEQKRLEEDKLRLQRDIESIKKRRSDGNHNQPLPSNALPKEKYKFSPNNIGVHDQVKEKYLLKDKSTIFMLKNPREEEITKLIDKISKPKEHQPFSSNKEQRRSYPQVRSDFSQFLSPVNIREKEKDKLSEKFASSENPLVKPSCRQVAKNLNSSISFYDYKQSNLEKASDCGRNIRNENKEQFNGGEKEVDPENREEYLRAKYNHPRIVVSHYKENNKDEEIGNTKENKMVRFGEFSPLNPNLPGGATVLGLGDWDEKRQLLLQKYKQVSRSPSPSPSEGDHNHSQRSIATQTDLGDDWSSPTLEKSPQHLYQTTEKSVQNLHGRGYEDEEKRCTSPQFRLSPIPKCYENMTEKEVKEFIYRQELEKQIEEKNRLKEEKRKKEAEEEAKIEARIEKDLEKMRRQYEEERLQRLEHAIRRQEQEDLLRERLAVEQQKAMKESKVVKKRPMKASALTTCKQREKNTHSDLRTPANVNVGRAPPSQSSEKSAASALSSVHEELRQPLLQLPEGFPISEELKSFHAELVPSSPPISKANKSTVHTSVSPPISVHRSKEVDILAQKAVFDTNLRTTPKMNNVTSFHSDTTRDRLREVENILKQPLFPETRVLPPVSQPLLHATIPPLSASLQTQAHRHTGTLPGSNRSNADILEDKWKVPYAQQDTEAAPNTKHNPRILTQLGTFRRQLQEESLRMRQRVREDSP